MLLLLPLVAVALGDEVCMLQHVTKPLEVSDCDFMKIAEFCKEHPGQEGKGATCSVSCGKSGSVDALQNSGSMTIGGGAEPAKPNLAVSSCDMTKIGDYCKENHGVDGKGPSCSFTCGTSGAVEHLTNSGTMTIGLLQKPLEVSDCDFMKIAEFCKEHPGQKGKGATCSVSCGKSGSVDALQNSGSMTIGGGAEPAKPNLAVSSCDMTKIGDYCKENHGVDGKGPSCSFTCGASGTVEHLTNSGTMTIGLL